MHLIRLSNSFVLISMCINQKKLRGWKHEQPTKSWAYYLDRHYTESTGGAHCHSIPCHYRLQGSSQGLRAPSACSVPCGAHWLPPPNANSPIYRTRERILPWCSHTRYCTTVAVIQDQRPVPTTSLLPKPQWTIRQTSIQIVQISRTTRKCIYGTGWIQQMYEWVTYFISIFAACQSAPHF